MVKFFASLIFLIGLNLPYLLVAQNTSRPIIWVTPADREGILNKIKTYEWTAQYYDAFKRRVQLI